MRSRAEQIAGDVIEAFGANEDTTRPILDLLVTCDRQRREIATMNEVLHRKNVELDALHMVWCDGGCEGGVHRWTDDPITEEIVAAAERNTVRLRRWFDAVRFKLERYLTQGEYWREYAERLERKVG